MALHATRHLDSPDATTAFARGLAHVLRGGDVVALGGDLGAGKTTLVRDLALALGAPTGVVHSPTFVMVNEYPLRGSGIIQRLVHVDAYRLHGSEDLDTLGWDTFVDMRATDAQGRPLAAQSSAVLVIEWAARIESALPSPERLASITLTPTSESSREALLVLPESWRDRPGVRELLERDPIRCKVRGKWVSPTSATYPFADDRARMADLGRWFGEGFWVSREAKPEDVGE
jgi:tRNA threonylcarbamoyladenosine biosynthesis protein TsaE